MKFDGKCGTFVKFPTNKDDLPVCILAGKSIVCGLCKCDLLYVSFSFSDLDLPGLGR